jgi:cell division protein FtsL
MMLLLCAGVSCALGAMAMAALRRQAAASRADGRERAAAWWLEWHELTERER